MNNLKTSFGIDDTYTKLYRRPTHPDEMTKVKDQIPLIPDYKFGLNKLLVICDITDDTFDIEKMKGESAQETLNAYKKIIQRGVIKIPHASF